jgi:hypothetical protein
MKCSVVLFYNLCNTSITCAQALVLQVLVPQVLVPLELLVRQVLQVRRVPQVLRVPVVVLVLVQEPQLRVSSLQPSGNRPLRLTVILTSASQE